MAVVNTRVVQIQKGPVKSVYKKKIKLHYILSNQFCQDFQAVELQKVCKNFFPYKNLLQKETFSKYWLASSKNKSFWFAIISGARKFMYRYIIMKSRGLKNSIYKRPWIFVILSKQVSCNFIIQECISLTKHYLWTISILKLWVNKSLTI